MENLKEKKLVGKRMTMSLAADQTPDLWKSFMPFRKDIKNPIGTELYSVEVYRPDYFTGFDPKNEFEKWAAVEVADLDGVPAAMEPVMLPGGLYAVFSHKGPASTAPNTYGYIYTTWLPKSGYVLDNRPHFAVMGEKYKNESPDSEEEIWIPVKLKP